MTDTEKVDDFMRKLAHPLKAEIEAVRAIILRANNKIAERVKWNAPSFHYKADLYKTDLVTFNPRAQKQVHLVFHHPAIVTIKSNLLEGDYPDRRMLYLADMAAVHARKATLARIINELVNRLSDQ